MLPNSNVCTVVIRIGDTKIATFDCPIECLGKIMESNL